MWYVAYRKCTRAFLRLCGVACSACYMMRCVWVGQIGYAGRGCVRVCVYGVVFMVYGV